MFPSSSPVTKFYFKNRSRKMIPTLGKSLRFWELPATFLQLGDPIAWSLSSRIKTPFRCCLRLKDEEKNREEEEVLIKDMDEKSLVWLEALVFTVNIDLLRFVILILPLTIFLENDNHSFDLFNRLYNCHLIYLLNKSFWLIIEYKHELEQLLAL